MAVPIDTRFGPDARSANGYRERRALPSSGAFRLAWVRSTDADANGKSLALPDGAVDLVWNGSQLIVAGPGRGAVEESVTDGSNICGLRFQRGAAASWLGISMRNLVGQRVPLADIIGAARARPMLEQVRAAPDARSALIALESEVRGPGDPVGYAFATQAIQSLSRCCDAIGIEALRLSIPISERTLRRRFDQVFGYGPRTLARILRLEQLMAALRDEASESLASTAVGSGYADQAHMTREVRALTNLTPIMLRFRQKRITC